MNWGHVFLTLHLIGVAGWLGGAVYERLFIAGAIHKNAGTPLEMLMTRLLFRTVPFFLTSVLLLLIGGIGMTLFYHLGWFPASWLGIKQGLMLAILAGFGGYVAPTMGRAEKAVLTVGDKSALVPDEARRDVKRFLMALDIMHVGVVINFLLGIWQPF